MNEQDQDQLVVFKGTSVGFTKAQLSRVILPYSTAQEEKALRMLTAKNARREVKRKWEKPKKRGKLVEIPGVSRKVTKRKRKIQK